MKRGRFPVALALGFTVVVAACVGGSDTQIDPEYVLEVPEAQLPAAEAIGTEEEIATQPVSEEATFFDGGNGALTNPKGATIASRFAPPEGYTRVPVQRGSFAEYLRHLPLKPDGSPVLYYDGMEKPNYAVYAAVIDLPIGTRDLHQCADAVIRLRAEYLWRAGRYHDIHFNLTNGFRMDYSEWMRGNRLVVDGNHTSWSNHAQPSNTYDDFWAYCQMVFAYAGSYSLSKELQPIRVADMQIGDVIILGGFPGHSEIVVDMARRDDGQFVFLLAQSYMPAQELQVLINPNDQALGPWHRWADGEEIHTAEYSFPAGSLKRFQD
ncbi:MAG: hypothetical protein CSA07_04350 [Bacteroidia bacterium]|nr:MAG: hypothetical protein CSA07_04350 [Bacteroidia bacterium]